MNYSEMAAAKFSVMLSLVAIIVNAVPKSLPFFEVGYSTVGMAIAGSILAFAYSPVVTSRKRMYGYAVGGVFIGIWGLKLLQWKGVHIGVEFEPMFAGLIALVSQQIIPPIVEILPTLLTKFASFGRKPNDQ